MDISLLQVSIMSKNRDLINGYEFVFHSQWFTGDYSKVEKYMSLNMPKPQDVFV